MEYGAEAEKRQRIEQLVETVRDRWSGETADEVATFIEWYYRGAAPEDVLPRSLEDLYGAAVSHWHLLKKAGPLPRIRVYNPDAEQDGWQSTHTAVQIVSRDMPFLVDSLSLTFNRLGQTIHLIIHPVIPVCWSGDAATVADDATCEGHAACMHFEVDRQTERTMLETIQRELAAALEDVRLAVDDWRPMQTTLLAVAGELESSSAAAADNNDEAVAFLRWLADNHFTLLGYRCYDLTEVDGVDTLRVCPGSGLGILRRQRPSTTSRSFAALPPEVRALARQPDPLIVTKSNSRATVHRPGYLDYVGVKRFDDQQRVIGEHRFLGLYTSTVYNRSPRDIPLLRRKVDDVLAAAGLPLRSHAGKALLNILETYPRDELFQIDADDLYQIALGILHLQERQRTRLFVRYDRYRRFVSCLVYAPRERYNTAVREQMQAILQDTFKGTHSEFSVQLSESVLARIHFVVHLAEPSEPNFDHVGLEQLLAETMRSWRDDFLRALLEQFGEGRGNTLFNRYRDAYPVAYHEDTLPRTAAHDTERLEALTPEHPLVLNLYRPLEALDGMLRLKLYHLARPITLSEVLPMLENMGVRVIEERPYEVTPAQGETLWIHDIGLHYEHGEAPDDMRMRGIFQDALAAAWFGHIENDGFNRLSLHAGLIWQEVVILRAYCKYLRQAGTVLSQAYIEATLAAYPHIARDLVELFHARLSPTDKDEARESELIARIEASLNEVPSLDEDRILRRYLAAIRATLRTNYYQRTADGGRKPQLSLKLAPDAIPDVPEPLPKYEIFVYSPRLEAVHLRGGDVARGGIRWSDRREDFRTEVLGLMKAQMVKNAVIVPVGAKGGFFPKQLPAGDRETVMEEVRACYSDFIRGMLDITDNRVDSEVVPPPDVVRHDGDDPYLVVAADKGTATFSDLANSISEASGFWLQDAFASGGSTGYDHKKLGITARGAWEAVKRHFRELGIDIQRQDFTAVGIGDMSGDVFGNGMLLSPHIKLIAAFDHRHVFIDPDPDPQVSYDERARLFAQPRSSWDDYDRDKLSAGGGVWPRSAKSIDLPEQARAALGIEQERVTPNELVRAILQAPVDLLWNGGIGTYVKASDETHADAGDKANDAVRVNGRQLRSKVVGEGGNLGFTQRGRIEYALHGGRINTDAIDNSGGVDCSDHEVNIKILLNDVVGAGQLTLKQRNRLLADMADDVSRLVLRDNYRQTQALSLGEADSQQRLDEHGRLIRFLEREAGLDRDLEFLPSEEILTERAAAKQGLTRPELAVLLAYSKIHGFRRLLEDPLLDEQHLEQMLFDYFPEPLTTRFPDAVRAHRLRREITATALINRIVNRMGPGFLFRMRQQLGADEGDTARAYLAASRIYDLEQWWDTVDSLDNQVPAPLQVEMLIEFAALQERACNWLLCNLQQPLSTEDTVQRLKAPVDTLHEHLPQFLPLPAREQLDQQASRLQAAGVPPSLAYRAAAADTSYAALDIAFICGRHDTPLDVAARVYFSISEDLGISWLRLTLSEFNPADVWAERLRSGLESEVYVQLRLLAADVLTINGNTAAQERIDIWNEMHKARIDRLCATLNELRGAPKLGLPMLAVAVQELKQLVQATVGQRLDTEQQR